MELRYKVQNYEWGKRGSQSQVAALASNIDKTFKIDENKPYSELWIGTHVNGPTSIKKTNELLSKILLESPEYLGEAVLKSFGQQLPFLFKVLSVNQALSIQAHPAKKHAEELHAKRPDLYKDANHKPELAIALTPFEALCGFRPLPDIYSFLNSIPELQKIVGNTILAKYNYGDTNDVALLKEAFKALLTTSKDVINEALKSLIERFKSLDEQSRENQLAELIETLHTHYPGDVGCFVVYFLNYIKLDPFEALYLEANEPHAYLYGDCVECMACSDNVVRAGLTPKYIDVETLCEMLIYKGEKPEDKIFKPISENDCSQLFKPPVPDFAVAQIKVPTSKSSYTLISRATASTLLVITGNAKSGDINLIPGTAVFIPANDTLVITNVTENLLVYQALANVGND